MKKYVKRWSVLCLFFVSLSLPSDACWDDDWYVDYYYDDSNNNNNDNNNNEETEHDGDQPYFGTDGQVAFDPPDQGLTVDGDYYYRCDNNDPEVQGGRIDEGNYAIEMQIDGVWYIEYLTPEQFEILYYNGKDAYNEFMLNPNTNLNDGNTGIQLLK